VVQLRPRQTSGLAQVKKAFNEGKHKVLYVEPPGAGKGTVIAYLMSQFFKAGMTAVFIIHKKDLVEQQAERISEQFGCEVGYYSSGVKQVDRPLMVGTVQTMINRELPKFDLVLIDEGHRVNTNQHQEVLGRVFKKYLIAFTATPFRGDKKGFDKDFDILIQASRYWEQVKDRNLVHTRVIAPQVSPSSDGLHIRATSMGKDFDDQEQFQRYNEERIYRGVVEKWLEYASDLKTIVFTVNSQEHLKKTCDWFISYGIDARYIDAKTPAKERKAILSAFKNNEFPVLCNIAIFSEGLSIDDVQCIVANFMTQIPTKWIQAMTRGSRPVWNEDYSDWKKVKGEYLKTECLILDFGGNCMRLGRVDDYDIEDFSLIPKPKGNMPMPTKQCPECDLVIRASQMTCECGHIFPVKEKDRQYADEVEWREVTLEDTAQRMFMEYSDMPYGKLIKKLIPANALIIAKCKDYKPEWAFRALIKKAGEAQFTWSNDVLKYKDGTYIDFKGAELYLYDAMEKSGMVEIYEKIP